MKAITRKKIFIVSPIPILPGNVISRHSKDLTELRKIEAQIRRDIDDGLDTYAMGNATLNYLYDRYISLKSNLKSTTIWNYKNLYDSYVRSGFGNRKVASIKYSDIMAFYQSLLDKGLSVSVVDSVHTLLHPTFALGVRDDILRKNPTDGVMAELKKNNKIKKNSGIRNALSPEQEKAFLKCLDNPEYSRWRPLFYVMFGTGVRISELIGIIWDDVDFEKRVLHIKRNVTYCPRHDNDYRCEFRVSTTKTQAGIRKIPMVDKVYEAFMEEKKYQDENDLHCKVCVDGVEGFVFFNRFQKLHSQYTVNRAIKRIVTKYNYDEEVKAIKQRREPLFIPDFSCHIIRHTFCSRLCENETNIKVIQSVMGHADAETTLNIYAQVFDAKKTETMNEISDKGLLL